MNQYQVEEMNQYHVVGINQYYQKQNFKLLVPVKGDTLPLQVKKWKIRLLDSIV